MRGWKVERIINFDLSGSISKDGYAYFGFHDRTGAQYAISHQRHFLGLAGTDNLKWTAAAHSVSQGTPNIATELKYPMYIDSLLDGTLVATNFGNNRLYRIDSENMKAVLLVDGSAIGMKDMGNCVVDDEGYIWINEVVGCKVWRFEPSGKPNLVIGNGESGFQRWDVDFDKARFSWIYDIRRGPDGNIYVLDSRNFAVRVINLNERIVSTIAGTGKEGYYGDGGSARLATFGGDSKEKFSGPISMSLDEEGNTFVGDRFNRVVRMIHKRDGLIETIAGNHHSLEKNANDPSVTDPLKLNLPKISSMDYHQGRLFVPTDLMGDFGDLIVLVKGD